MSKVEDSTRHLASKEDLAKIERKSIKYFVSLSIILALLILGLYVLILVK